MNVFRKLKVEKKNSISNNVSNKANNIKSKEPSFENVNNKIAIKSHLNTIPINAKVDKNTINNNLSNDLSFKANINDKNVLVVKNNKTKETLVAGVLKDDDNNSNKGQMHTFQIKTRKHDMPNFDDLPINKNSLISKEQQLLDLTTKNMFVDILKKNKLTFGTKQMMDNDLIHAKEAIESGIYITWTSKSVNLIVICLSNKELP